jgi:phenylacetate-CoA ligase
MIYGYTNSLVLFAKYLIKKNLILKKICTSLKLCISTSELLSIQDRETILSGFGVTVVNEYGVSEAGGIAAFEDLDSDWILSSETQFLEIVDDNESLVSNGNSGKILITDLHNKAMPFIRYEVGDIGIVKRSKNNGKLTLASLTGRTNDLILLPSGKKSPGLTFYYISRSILESSGILKEFIIRQVQKDKFIFDIKADRDLTQDEVKDIKSKMDIYLEPGLRLEINRTEQIRRPASGKQKHFYSEISD